jgi:glutamate synthase domain-containing protein 3
MQKQDSKDKIKIMHRSPATVLDSYSTALLKRIYNTKFVSTYERSSELLRPHAGNYTTRDIERFYSSLKSDVNTIDAGTFISAAINNIIKDGDHVTLGNNGLRLHYMGMHLERGTLVIEGNVLNHLGYKMKGGRIIVKGDALNFAGSYMAGGNIEIQGRAASNVGDNMQGGRLLVNNRAGYNIGNCASPNARIILMGGYEQIALNCKALLRDD